MKVDFSSKKCLFRQRAATTLNEAIAKAVGLKKNKVWTVIDATAGLGQDAFILASLGAQVLLLERSPVIAALLREGLETIVDPILRERMHLIEIDACDYLATLEEASYPDVIYCDPMFPKRQKSALVKKEMQFLQSVLESESEVSQAEGATLLAIALQCAKNRVVVKRPRVAPALQGRQPDFSHQSKNNRFDIYLTLRIK